MEAGKQAAKTEIAQRRRHNKSAWLWLAVSVASVAVSVASVAVSVSVASVAVAAWLWLCGCELWVLVVAWPSHWLTHVTLSRACVATASPRPALRRSKSAVTPPPTPTARIELITPWGAEATLDRDLGINNLHPCLTDQEYTNVPRANMEVATVSGLLN